MKIALIILGVIALVVLIGKLRGGKGGGCCCSGKKEEKK